MAHLDIHDLGQFGPASKQQRVIGLLYLLQRALNVESATAMPSAHTGSGVTVITVSIFTYGVLTVNLKRGGQISISFRGGGSGP